jgi:hypothetical protein
MNDRNILFPLPPIFRDGCPMVNVIPNTEGHRPDDDYTPAELAEQKLTAAIDYAAAQADKVTGGRPQPPVYDQAWEGGATHTSPAGAAGIAGLTTDPEVLKADPNGPQKSADYAQWVVNWNVVFAAALAEKRKLP